MRAEVHQDGVLFHAENDPEPVLVVRHLIANGDAWAGLAGAGALNGLPGNWRRAGRRGAFIATIMRLPWSCRAADLSGLSAGHGQTMNEQPGKRA